jgi:hypothetical protein
MTGWPNMQFLTTKFLAAVLPVVLLGYILGALISAAYQGLHVHPGLLVIISAGIVIAFDEIRSLDAGRS